MFLTNVPIEPPKLIEYLQPETKIEIQIEPSEARELTVQEKIDQNFYNCNEEVEYIRADNAECLAKPVQAPRATSTTQTVTNTTQAPKATRTGSTAHSGWYPAGQCTHYVASRRPVGQWNNATQWKYQAIADGYTHSYTPVAGAIAWKPGHVAYVESVSGNMVTISEANYDYRGSVRTITIPASSYSYLY